MILIVETSKVTVIDNCRYEKLYIGSVCSVATSCDEEVIECSLSVKH